MTESAILYADTVSRPPKSIWDPEVMGGDGTDDDATNNTGMSMSTAARLRRNTEITDTIKVRVQLWDSYRLARIITGTPIKSFNLKSKTILHSIRIVAEMKLELIHLRQKVKALEKAAEDYNNNNNNNIHHQQQQQEEGGEGEKGGGEKIENPHKEQVENLKELQKEFSEMIQVAESSVKRTKEQWKDAPKETRRELEIVLKGVLTKVEKISKETKQAIGRLNKTMKEDGKTVAVTTQKVEEKMQRELAKQRELHQIEMQTVQHKHLQQLMDMSGQLETYREQVNKQNEEIAAWHDRYHQLDDVAVTPEQAHDVLGAINSITEHSTLDEQMQVQQKVVGILERMAQMYTRQVADDSQLQATLEAAKIKEKRSREDLKDLRCEEELLREETMVPVDDWREALASQRKFCKQQIEDIMSREEKRLLEMEFLEMRLTDMSFASVEIEELQKEIKENQKNHSDKVSKANTEANDVARSMYKIKKKMEEVMRKQKASIKELAAAGGSTGHKVTELQGKMNDVDLLHTLEQELAQRDKELDQTKNDLSKMQARVELLEHKLQIAESQGEEKKV